MNIQFYIDDGIFGDDQKEILRKALRLDDADIQVAQDEAIAGDKAKKRALKSVCSVLWLIVFPIFISFLLLFYINLPTAVRIISNSQLSLWHFNVDSTLYVFVVLALLAFVFFNLWLIIQLICKWIKLK